MVKPGTLLLLLTVAASQVGLLSAVSVFQTPGGTLDISDCPITFYGQRYTTMEVVFQAGGALDFCFQMDPLDASSCLQLVDRGVINTVEVTTIVETASSVLPNIFTNSECHLQMRLLENAVLNALIELYDFGHQAAVYIQTYAAVTTVDVNTRAGDVTLYSTSQSPEDANAGFDIDVSGCRYSDVTLEAGQGVQDPDTCFEISCDASASLVEVRLCEPWEDCQSIDTCIPGTYVCTVTGSTVIDFFNRVYHVPDRCTYTLMKGTIGSESLVLSAGFQERRRTDVPFLDYLIISLTSVEIYLEQGGRAKVDGTIVTLTTTAQVFSGVELMKDQSGITANILLFGVTVFFDGNTAHVSGNQPGDFAPVTGLCGASSDSSATTTLTAEKSEDSDVGCETLHPDAADITIDCSGSTERCTLMVQGPFSACNYRVDPTPYITACINTLCQYPEVDGLICHFLEAYAKSCGLRSDVAQGDWRSEAGCSVVLQDSCRDQYCSDNEFCGEKLGETRCLCRALFAATFDTTNPFGEATVCMENSGSLTLAACLLWDKGIDYSSLHLIDETCIGLIDDQTHMVTFSFDSSNTCGAEITMTDTHVIYQNTIMTRSDSASSIINHYEHVEIDFSCSYEKPDAMSMSFRIKDSSVVVHIESDIWNYILTMSAYLDPNHQKFLEPGLEIQINQRIWLEMKTEGLDDAMVAVVTDSCWATDELPDSSLRYDLIIDGCPNTADQTVQLKGNGLGLSNYFSFSMFEFFEADTRIYLHCKVELCPKQGQSCAPDCSGVGPGRKRRSSSVKYADENSVLITMVWSN